MARKTEAEIRLEERSRIAAIMTSEEGAARPKSALKLALYSDLSEAMARDMLAGLPVESAFAMAMDREGPVNIGAALGGPATHDVKELRKAELSQAAAAHALGKGYISPEKAAARGVKVSA